jgi:predicted nucleic acid-binding protein
VKYLLDTPLLAELVRARSDEWLCRWIDAFNEDEIYLSALTVGEITRSIESEQGVERKSQLRAWLSDELLVRFHGKIIPLDLEILNEWGRVTAETEAAGKPLSALDGMIAATVRARGLVLITYNREVFSAAGIEVSDPWQG